MSRALIVACLLLPAANAANAEVDEVATALTAGRWVKTIGSPKMPDRYVYTFAKNGTYKSVLISDFTPRPTTTGQWRLIKAADGKVHLRLTHKEGKYPWLRADSVVRHDGKRDLLLISGPGYAGEVPLRHEKAH